MLETHGAAAPIIYMDSKIFDFVDVSHPDSLATIKETLIAAQGPRAEDSSIKIEKCSPVAPVTLKGEPLKKAKIPDDATSFCYTYPLKVHRVDNLGCPLVSLLTIGSFVYFDNMLNVVGINALSFEEPNGTKADLGAQIIYGERQALKGKESDHARVLRHLEGSDGGIRRWHQATAKSIRALGYTHYAWITPSEVIPARHQNENELQCPKYGGFAYKRDNSGSGEADLFPIVGAKAGEDAENLMLQPYDLYGQLLTRLEDWPNHPLAPKQAPPSSPIEDLIKMLKHRAHSKPPRLIFDKSMLPTRQVFGSSLLNSEVACLHEPKSMPMCTHFPAYHLDNHAPICRLAGRQGGEEEGKSRLYARHDGLAEGTQLVERGERQKQRKRKSPC